jgi:DNA-binding XRE family transcriptional regulator
MPNMSKIFQLSIDKCSYRAYTTHRNDQNEQGRGDKMLSSIEAERARVKMSKEDLAKALGVTPRTIYNWVAEETDVPSSYLIKMAKLFGVTVDYLLAGSEGVKREAG